MQALIPRELLLHLAVPTGLELVLEHFQLVLESRSRTLTLFELVLALVNLVSYSLELLLLLIRQLLDIVVLVLYVGEREGDLGQLVLLVLVCGVLV